MFTILFFLFCDSRLAREPVAVPRVIFFILADMAILAITNELLTHY